MFGVLETSAKLFGHWTAQSSLKKKYVKKPKMKYLEQKR